MALAAALGVVANRVPVTLGPSLLIALVLGFIIGSGVFGLPQNMPADAGAGVILFAIAIYIGLVASVGGRRAVIGSMEQIKALLSGVTGSEACVGAD